MNINFNGKRVLVTGAGRGEELKVLNIEHVLILDCFKVSVEKWLNNW